MGCPHEIGVSSQIFISAYSGHVHLQQGGEYSYDCMCGSWENGLFIKIMCVYIKGGIMNNDVTGDTEEHKKVVEIEPVSKQRRLSDDVSMGGILWQDIDERLPRPELPGEPPDESELLKKDLLGEVAETLDSASRERLLGEIAGVLDYASDLKLSGEQEAAAPDDEPVVEEAPALQKYPIPGPIALENLVYRRVSQSIPTTHKVIDTCETFGGKYIRIAIGKFNPSIFDEPIDIPEQYTVQDAVDKMRGEGLLAYLRILRYEGMEIGKSVFGSSLKPLLDRNYLLTIENAEALSELRNFFDEGSLAYKTFERIKDYLRPLAASADV